ncbi:hypothetical protein C4O04_05105 [Salmonella enterica subsp. enterica serovar Poona]|nr:hypothetical protein [Salmonella enterica subsp. enterica serovar Poona]
MSYTSVIYVWPGEKSDVAEELRNAWGSVPVVWDHMAKRYFGKSWWSCMDTLWLFARRQDIPFEHRAVLAMTYDRMYVKREHYELAAQCIRQYLAQFPTNDGRVNHWPRIAEIFESNPDCPAIGLWCTSACENPFSGEWNDELGDYGQPDWSRFWSLFDWLNDGTGVRCEK